MWFKCLRIQYTKSHHSHLFEVQEQHDEGKRRYTGNHVKRLRRERAVLVVGCWAIMAKYIGTVYRNRLFAMSFKAM